MLSTTQVLSGSGEPLRAYLLCVVLASVVIIGTRGDMNTIAPIVTNLYMVVYCVLNWSCFYASHSKSPGWRPGFKYYHKYLALTGVAFCLAFMFLVSYISAFIVLGFAWVFFKVVA